MGAVAMAVAELGVAARAGAEETAAAALVAVGLAAVAMAEERLEAAVASTEAGLAGSWRAPHHC